MKRIAIRMATLAVFTAVFLLTMAGALPHDVSVRGTAPDSFPPSPTRAPQCANGIVPTARISLASGTARVLHQHATSPFPFRSHEAFAMSLASTGTAAATPLWPPAAIQQVCWPPVGACKSTRPFAPGLDRRAIMRPYDPYTGQPGARIVPRSLASPFAAQPIGHGPVQPTAAGHAATTPRPPMGMYPPDSLFSGGDMP